MSDENGENEATEQTEQYEEEDQEEVEEAPENADQDGGRHCDLFGELNAPAGEEATAETEEGNETKEDVQEEEDTNAEQNDAEQNDAEQTDKPEEEEATETKESTEEKDGDGEKPAEQAEGDQQQSSDDPSAQPGTKTNSDRQQDIFSRVFVGHLPTDRCTRNDVEKLFSQYGIITGCSVLNGYGFVQYKTPDSVDEAIRHLHGHHFFGANIVVDKTDAARAALGEKPQKRPTPRRSGGYNRDYHQPPPRSHGYRDYGPPPYHPRGYGPPPHHYDHRESYYHPPQRRGPPQHHYGYHRPRDDYYDGRPHYDYSEY